MKQITHRLNIARNPSLLIPVVLVGMMTLSFGLLLPWQGYTFSDEWHFIYYSLIDGPRGLPELFHYDGHPQSTWGYILGFRLLGYSPLGWHLLSFFWRTANVLMFWGLLNLVWPTKRQQTFTAALFFALYPFFTLQVFAITYFEVWYSFFLLWLSMFLTIKAIRQPEKFWIWTMLAITIKVGHVFTSEYNWFLESLRPVFIWLVLPSSLPRTEKLRRTVMIWLPYFALFFTSVLWRGFFYQPLRKSFRVIESAFSNPFLTLLSALRHWIPDSGLTLFTSWYSTLKPEYLDFANRTNILILFVALSGAALAYFGLRKANAESPSIENDNRWAVNALVAGVVGLIAGFIPSYAAGYAAYLSDWPGNARLALAAFPGAALILTALLDLTARPRAKLVIIAILAGLMVNWHVRVNHEFRMVWETQKDFYQQLTWRIPDIRPNTVLLLPTPYLPRLSPDSPAQMSIASDLAVALATNAFYSAPPNRDGRISYWFSTHLYAPKPGKAPPQPEISYATLYFSGEPGQVITLHFNPREGECLRVLGPEYADYKRIPPEIKEAASLSRPENILPNAKTDFRLLNTIIGTENKHRWCFYYQKGALAAQKQDWDETIRLWKDAKKLRLLPRNGYEFIPFIDAQLHTAQWENAAELTRAASRITQGMDAALCPLWKNAKLGANPSPAQEQATQRVNEFLKCGFP
jgi:hypothetical protein